MLQQILIGVAILLVLYLVYVLLRYFKFFENLHLTSQMSADENVYDIPFEDWCPSGVPSSNFTLSIWFYVSSWDTSTQKYIFERLTDENNENEISAYLEANTNDLVVEFSDDDNQNTTCTIENIPLQKWIHLAVVKYGEVVDIYVDGKLLKSCVSSTGESLARTPSSTPITLHGTRTSGTSEDQGFDGYTTYLKYFNSTKSPQEIYNIYAGGYGGSFLDSMLGGYSMRMSLFRNDEEIAGLGLG